MKYFATIFLLSISSVLFAQKTGFTPDINTSFSSYASSGDDLPFWMTANQNGVFTMHNSTYQLLQAGLERSLKRDSAKTWGYMYGANLVYGYAGASDFQVNQYWAGLRYKWLVLRAGAKPEAIQYAGLSSTNGNMYWSNNSRPLPGVTLSTNGFIPFFFWKNWFSFKAEYQENLLRDDRYVMDSHLHHKSLYLRAQLPKNWRITAGLDHNVFWGGTSPNYGKLPGMRDYLRYILGQAGSSSAPKTDILNAEGNTLGMYSLEIKKNYANMSLAFYYNHPFEDRSGLEMANLRDGLWGLHYANANRKAFLTDAVVEYMNTRNQSGSFHDVPAPTPDNPNRLHGRGNDDYFNHGVYKSGYVYENHMMGTPFFVPNINHDGISTGFSSTRMWMQHFGLKGNLCSHFTWRTLLSWSRNFGRYDAPYPSPLDEFSFLAESRYHSSKLPFDVKFGLAGDYGDRFQSKVGAFVGIHYAF